MKKQNSNSPKSKTPWPTKDAMEQVYVMKLWGDNQTKFYSGEGSHLPEIVFPYVDVVVSFLTSFKKPLVVCDLGCGDFNVGKEFVAYTEKYIAVDIVPDLIAHNKSSYQSNSVEFLCLDIAKEDLPKADCVMLRQVLQHLSNTEVQQVLNKLSAYKYVILTEHIPSGNFETNKDIISGQGTRLKKGSGLDILKPPFNFWIKEKERLLSIPVADEKGVIETTLFTLF